MEVPVIRRLDKVVVNRIAAGEVIHRPSSALKELIENCLDAKSTKIGVVLKEGGLKVLQVTDNGCGIRQEDFPILCERFTTSKIASYEDLSKISTFGFRGEALASITHVAHVTITSMTSKSVCAYRAMFSDGKLVPEKVGEAAEVKPCAGVKGTQITAEDLFFNVPVRLQAMKSGLEEYIRCLEVVTKYAIHYSGVNFTCKKMGNPKTDVNTLPSASKLDNIKSIYGQSVSKELLPLEFKSLEYDFQLNGLVSNANYNMKKFEFILFINNRLVESNTIKKAIDSVYSAFLPRNTHPFVYLSVVLPPQNVDVNVHPTKKEVRFLFEEQIVEGVQEALSRVLKGANSSRTFYTQTVLPGLPALAVSSSSSSSNSSSTASTCTSTSIAGSLKLTITTPAPHTEGKAAIVAADNMDEDFRTDTASSPPIIVPPRALTIDAACEGGAGGSGGGGGAGGTGSSSSAKRKARRDDKLVRTESDNPSGRLDAYLRRANSAPTASGSSSLSSAHSGIKVQAATLQLRRQQEEADSLDTSAEPTEAKAQSTLSGRRARPKVPRKPIVFDSVKHLLREIDDDMHQGLRNIFQHHTFVGCVNETHAIVQHKTKLYLLNIPKLSRAFMYEQVMRNFMNVQRNRLSSPASIRSLLLLALECPLSGWKEGDEPKEDIAKYIDQLLLSKAPMLLEYFGIEIEEHDPHPLKVPKLNHEHDGQDESMDDLDPCMNGNQADDRFAQLVALPELVEEYCPPLATLPMFLLRLGTEVDWTQEKPCFQSVCDELAGLYYVQPGRYLSSPSPAASVDFSKADPSAAASSSSSSNQPASPSEHTALMWTIEHVLFPCFRHSFSPPKAFATDGSVIQIASLENLYKIFERC